MAGKGDPEQGRRDNRRGYVRQREAAAWLRAEGYYPLARAASQFPGEAWQSDLDEVGPRVIEVTVSPWDKMPGKLRQAERAADNTGRAEFAVWKHIGRGANETGATADDVLIMRARVAWALFRELDELRAFAQAHGWQGMHADGRGLPPAVADPFTPAQKLEAARQAAAHVRARAR